MSAVNQMTMSGEDLLALPDSSAKVDELVKLGYELRNSNHKQAAVLAAEALRVAERLDYEKGIADSKCLVGFSCIHRAENEKALSLMFEALELYGKINDDAGIANAKYNLGLLYLRMGIFNQSVQFLHDSLELREKLGDRAGAALCYFQLTYIDQHFNDLEAAEEKANRVAAIRKELNDRNGLAAIYMILGELYLKKGELDKAEQMLSQSMQLRKMADEKMGYFATLMRWTELHVLRRQFDLARQFAYEGLTLSRNEDVRFGVIRFLQMLGKLEQAQGNREASKKAYLEALDWAEKYSFKSIEYELLEAISGIAREEGDYKNALEYYQRFHVLKEEVISLQTNTQLKSVQFMGQVEFARKEAELEKSKNAELEKAYKLVADKNKEILDSIHYARRIQQSLLPTEKYLEKKLDQLLCLKK